MSGTAFAVPLMMGVFILCASGAGDQKYLRTPSLASSLSALMVTVNLICSSRTSCSASPGTHPPYVIWCLRAQDLGQAVDKDMGNVIESPAYRPLIKPFIKS